MKIIGITGNIASGKTAVSKYLSQKGYPVIDADQLAREVVSAGAPALEEIKKTLGKDLADAQGSLNREEVRNRAFSDAHFKKKLEGILHPAIEKKSQEKFLEFKEKGASVLFYDASLLVETGRYRKLDGLLVVGVSPDIQLKRLLSRDQLTKELALKIMGAQLDQEEKKKFATWIIENNSTLDALERKIDALLPEILKL